MWDGLERLTVGSTVGRHETLGVLAVTYRQMWDGLERLTVGSTVGRHDTLGVLAVTYIMELDVCFITCL
jgi:hypothetical protein